MLGAYVAVLAGFRSPASLSTPRWRPKLASLLEVVALRQLALPEVEGKLRVAVTIHAIGEVLVRHVNDAPRGWNGSGCCHRS